MYSHGIREGNYRLRSKESDRRVSMITRAASLLCLVFVALLMGAAVSCGSSGDSVDPGQSGGSESPASGTPDEEGVRLITRPDASYTIDNLVAVGFKKSKQFELDTVPGAIDIWYGFFQQKDIEVRFYESHSTALAMGVELADEIIGRKAGQRDYLIPVVNLYPAYAVVGNVIMLCERQLATCEALIEVLE